MKFESIGNESKRFDLKSESSRMELAQLLMSQAATVKRSSGQEEYNWYVSGVHPDGVVVSKTGESIQKKVSLSEFKENNPELFINIEVTE